MREMIVVLTCFTIGMQWTYLVLNSTPMRVSKLKKVLDLTLDTLVALWALTLPILATIALKNVFLGFTLGVIIMGYAYLGLVMRLKAEKLETSGKGKAFAKPISYLATLATVLLEIALFFFFIMGNPSTELSWLVGGSIAALSLLIFYRQILKS